MGEVMRLVRKGRFIGWYVRYKDADGRRKFRASHQPSKELARRYLLEVEGRIARGLLGIPEPAPLAPTVAELTERFLSEYSRPKIKDLAGYRARARTALRRATAILGSLRVDAVQRADIASMRDKMLAQGAAPNTVRLTMAMLTTLFNWAIHEELVLRSPMKGAELPPRRDSVDHLSAAEVTALLAAAGQRLLSKDPADRCLGGMVHFALRTGLRKGELAALRWRDLELSTGRLTIARSFDGSTKSDKARHLRLPEEVIPLLKEWLPACPHTAEDLVFPQRRKRQGTWGMLTDSSAMLGLPELLAEAGCRHVARAWHLLRHTFASHFIMQGGSLLTLSKILGHADLKMTMLYAHLAPDFIGAEMSRVKF